MTTVYAVPDSSGPCCIVRRCFARNGRETRKPAAIVFRITRREDPQ
jgi:hypothetical protein